PLTWNQQGPKGDTGATGATGAIGPQGTPGVSGYEVVSAEGNGSANAFCPAGKRVMGGGGNVAGNGANLGFLIETAPLTVNGLDGWRIATWDTSLPVAVHAICAKVS